MASHVLSVQVVKEHTVCIGAENCMDVLATMINIRIRKMIMCAKGFGNHRDIEFYNSCYLSEV